MKTKELQINVVAGHHPDFHQLTKELDGYLCNLYNTDETFGIDPNHPGIENVHFVVAYMQETPGGCGAIRPIEENAVELKRFYVNEEYRGQGIGRKLLAFLEARGRERGASACKLETGEIQIEAVSLFKKCGYQSIDQFGPYADLEWSSCYAKRL
ncbi:GNAT family N-acetyltransferase [Shouchella shacheensis]|uniref:GNAT family N-acetyltransferase n=1 Tax=Shouchella shacheensis TaxID=1649580 RepID=UPI0007401AC2|nr:GNAT family N-acetyltransferase [Shouchella shacheensis]